MARGRRMLLALAVVAAAAAALVANVALLGLASETDDPVGRLRPVLPGLATTVIRPPEPVVTAPTAGGTETVDHSDGDRDGHGEGEDDD